MTPPHQLSHSQLHNNNDSSQRTAEWYHVEFIWKLNDTIFGRFPPVKSLTS